MFVLGGGSHTLRPSGIEGSCEFSGTECLIRKWATNRCGDHWRTAFSVRGRSCLGLVTASAAGCEQKQAGAAA